MVSTENLELLSDRGRQALETLVEHDIDGAQQHVYANWPPAGIEDDGKKYLAEQVGLDYLEHSAKGLYECNLTFFCHS